MYFSSVDNDTDMVSSTTGVSDVIASDFSGTVTSSTMSNNKWGYSLDNTDFSPIPTKNNQLTLKNLDHLPTTDAEKNATVNIGVKVDNTLASGVYSKDLVFSVVAHEVAINKNRLTELTSMQDSNLSSYCSASYTPTASATITTTSKTFNGDLVPEATLTDTRDGNTYTVRKLADGNCWMTDNLRLIKLSLTQIRILQALLRFQQVPVQVGIRLMQTKYIILEIPIMVYIIHGMLLQLVLVHQIQKELMPNIRFAQRDGHCLAVSTLKICFSAIL